MIPSRLIVHFTLSLCLLAPLIQAADFRYCDKKGGHGDVKVNGVEITPNPITRGKPANFTIKATADKGFSGGKLVIDVSYFIFHVYSETKNLCEETSCPVSTGDFVVSHSEILPGVTPPGSYTIQMKMRDAKNKELTCIAFDFSIGFGSSVADM
ncbi:Putative phosphatidylglycerol/phosphatidylinositol transfer protein DDB_G0282179 [Linum perenne]